MNEEKLAESFKALSDPNRLRLLERLAGGESCACTLLSGSQVSQPTVSYHLAFLTKAGLTVTEKKGVWNRHSINIKKVDELIAFLEKLKQPQKKGECHGKCIHMA